MSQLSLLLLFLASLIWKIIQIHLDGRKNALLYNLLCSLQWYHPFKNMNFFPDLSGNQFGSIWILWIQIVLETFPDISGGSSTINLPIFTVYPQCWVKVTSCPPWLLAHVDLGEPQASLWSLSWQSCAQRHYRF